jgi:hypothetical protein
LLLLAPRKKRFLASSYSAANCSNERHVWVILYSPGMPSHPTPQTDWGWHFDFPTTPNSAHYILAAVDMAASSQVNASSLVTTTETPLFDGRL